MISRMVAGLALATAVSVGCAGNDFIRGTKIEDTEKNRHILEVVEKYRRAMERRDPAALLAMAHPWYFEDSGTAKGDDDYGIKGLKTVLTERLSKVKSLRYGIQYKAIQHSGNRANIHIVIDASFQLSTSTGDRWDRKSDSNEIVLIKDAKGWRFLAGM